MIFLYYSTIIPGVQGTEGHAGFLEYTVGIAFSGEEPWVVEL